MIHPLKLCIIGASGRMGHELITAISNDSETALTGAIERADSSMIGNVALENCKITSDIAAAAKISDVIIDFSAAVGTYANLAAYRSAGKPLVIGSTGFSDAQLADVRSLQKDLPLLIASNMSAGVNVMAKLLELAAKALGSDFDIEVFEAHHKHKKDAPSGTALTLAEAAAKGRGLNLAEASVYSRHGMTGERKADTIGFQVMRGGDIAGDHTVFFCGDGERLEITHRASSRQTFAKGALRAAKWLTGKPKGLYSINQVLGL